MATRGDDDYKGNRLFCDAWNGTRSPAFLKFKRDFRAGAAAMFLHEDDYSVWQACCDADQGGNDPSADALPAQGQAGYLNCVRRRKKRQAKAFSIVYSHTSDERLKEMMDALPTDDRRGAEAWAYPSALNP